jgi:hypothetical protein
MQSSNTVQQLPDVEYIGGFSYLFQLMSHLTSSRESFDHKMHIIIQLSSHLSSGTFTRAEIEASFPQYPKKYLDSMITSLIDGGWLQRQEGTLVYQFSNSGMLFTRFLPFLYEGDKLDSMAFQHALKDLLDAAENMKLGINSLEFLRNQSIHAVMRNIDELNAALVSKNEARIKEALAKTDKFLENIGDFIKRFKDINDYKRTKQLEITEQDKSSIQCLFEFELKITSLFEHRKIALLQSVSMGNGVFTKEDVDRFLSKASFKKLSNMVENIHYAPAMARCIDEDGIITAFTEFIQLKKLRVSSNISKRVYGKHEKPSSYEPSYIDKALEIIKQKLDKEDHILIEDILLSLPDKKDVFMYLASMNFLAGKSYSPFSMMSTVHLKEFKDQILSHLSEATISRRDS